MPGDLRQQLLLEVLSHIRAAVLVEDEERRIAHVNPQFCRMFGIHAPPEALIGMDCTNAAEASKSLFIDADDFVRRIEQLLRDQEEVRGDLLETVDGRWLERDYLPMFVDGTYRGHMWVYRDVTEAQRHLRRMREIALHDELTGLFNRRGFMEMAPMQLQRAELTSTPSVLVVLDMDGLKQVNDMLGHAVGDAALVDFASMLRSVVRRTDVVARLGGDEFAALLTGTDDQRVLRHRLEQAIDRFNDQHDRPYRLAASAGFVSCHEGALVELLRRADEQMYRAKRRRKEEVSAVHCLSLLPRVAAPETAEPLPDTVPMGVPRKRSP